MNETGTPVGPSPVGLGATFSPRGVESDPANGSGDLRAAYGDPYLVEEYDEDGRSQWHERTVHWDIDFNLAINFGADFVTHDLHVFVSSHGVWHKRSVTSDQLRQFAAHLTHVADRADATA